MEAFSSCAYPSSVLFWSTYNRSTTTSPTRVFHSIFGNRIMLLILRYRHQRIQDTHERDSTSNVFLTSFEEEIDWGVSQHSDIELVECAEGRGEESITWLSLLRYCVLVKITMVQALIPVRVVYLDDNIESQAWKRGRGIQVDLLDVIHGHLVTLLFTHSICLYCYI